MIYKHIKIAYTSTNLNELIYFKHLITLIYYNLNYKTNLLTLNKINNIKKYLKKTSSLSLLKSPHVNKTAWHQFKKTTYKHNIIFKKLTYLQFKQLFHFIYTYKPININLHITSIK